MDAKSSKWLHINFVTYGIPSGEKSPLLPFLASRNHLSIGCWISSDFHFQSLSTLLHFLILFSRIALFFKITVTPETLMHPQGNPGQLSISRSLINHISQVIIQWGFYFISNRIWVLIRHSLQLYFIHLFPHPLSISLHSNVEMCVFTDMSVVWPLS